ncbi:MAG: hypothetical protein MUC50_21770 [Myxococcota bacterium]|jgi:pyruvate carboxylase|nr:hypothetical protein [Myxococcota bacterium]
MPVKTFDQVVEELRNRPILVANRGIPARRVARAIREVIQAVPIITATDVDKTSPLETLHEVEVEKERADLQARLKREPTHEELLMYLAHPSDALKTIEQQQRYGNPNMLPLDVWFEGLEPGEKLTYVDGKDKPHEMEILSLSQVDEQGVCTVRYTLDREGVLRLLSAMRGQGLATPRREAVAALWAVH